MNQMDLLKKQMKKDKALRGCWTKNPNPIEIFAALIFKWMTLIGIDKML